MSDFPTKIIEINSETDNWGPYKFKFPINSSEESIDGILPYGSTIADVSVTAFTFWKQQDITSLLIDPDYPVVFTDDSVIVRFCYPGESYKHKKVTLKFIITLSNGGVSSFTFTWVEIQ